MRKVQIVIILLCLVTISGVISLGLIGQNKQYDNVFVEVKNRERIIYITPGGDVDVIPLAKHISITGAGIESLSKDSVVLTEDFLIYTTDDYDKEFELTVKTMWGPRVYKLILLLPNHVKFHIGGDVVSVVKKDDLARGVGYPEGVTEWFINSDLTTPHSSGNFNNILALYA